MVNYEKELHFLLTLFDKCRLQHFQVRPDTPISPNLDQGLRSYLRWEENFSETFQSLLRITQPQTIYKLTDPFFCSYLFFQLPETEGPEILLLGPYLVAEPDPEQIMELAERAGFSTRHVRIMENHFASIPVFVDESPIFAAINTFGEIIWGSSEAFSLMDLNRELSDFSALFPKQVSGPEADDPLQNMRMMEARYAFENEMLSAVSHGLTHKVERLLGGFSAVSLEQRCADPVRNLKNYCIVMNTLLRKAAENGGVHPTYLDSTSSSFARKIESLSSIKALENLMNEMFHSYCRLVRKHSIKQYSLPVQKTIVHIDSDLSKDLSLKTLADLQNINASYLSSLFKKETGQTITDYVNQKRMQLAINLLSTTRLQIQTIAQHCGILDVNYFSKMFKKYTKQTPKEYRRAMQDRIVSSKIT